MKLENKLLGRAFNELQLSDMSPLLLRSGSKLTLKIMFVFYCKWTFDCAVTFPEQRLLLLNRVDNVAWLVDKVRVTT